MDTLEHDEDDVDESQAAKNPVKDDEEEELVTKLQKWERASRTHSSKWRGEAREDYDLVAGEQWKEEDKVALLDQMRQPIVFNRTAPMVDAVRGAEVLNRQEVHYSPQTLGKVQIAETMTAADRWARGQCDAEDEDSDAFADAITCGMGWTETYMDYSEDAAGRIMISRFDPLEAGWDPAARKPNIIDRRYCFRRRGFEKDELRAKFPGKASQIFNVLDDNKGDAADQPMDHRPPYDLYKEEENGNDGTAIDRLIYVTQFQWWDLEPGFAVSDPKSGMVKGMDADAYKQGVLQALMTGQQPLQAAKVNRKVYYEAFVSNNVLLGKRKLDCNAFTLNCITGKRDRNKNTWYGIVRAMRDPQRWANKWMSQILHILNTNSKGGLIYEEGVFTNQTKATEEWSRPDSMVSVKPGSLGRGAIQPKDPTKYPEGLDRLLEFAVGSFPQVTGINMELLGLVDRDQPGVLEQQRKRSGYAILAVYFDSLRRYRKMQGRVMMHYIQEYISDGRLIRITADDGSQEYKPLIRDPSVIEYDIVVDDAPMSQNAKDMVWGMIVQMMPMLKDAQVPAAVWADLIRYSPLPSTIAGKIGTAISQPADPKAEEMQQAEKILELLGMKAKAERDHTQSVLNLANAMQPQTPMLPDQSTQPEAPDMHQRMLDTHTTQASAAKDHATAAHTMAMAQKTQTEAQIAPIKAMHDMRMAEDAAETARTAASQPAKNV